MRIECAVAADCFYALLPWVHAWLSGSHRRGRPGWHLTGVETAATGMECELLRSPLILQTSESSVAELKALKMEDGVVWYALPSFWIWRLDSGEEERWFFGKQREERPAVRSFWQGVEDGATPSCRFLFDMCTYDPEMRERSTWQQLANIYVSTLETNLALK